MLNNIILNIKENSFFVAIIIDIKFILDNSAVSKTLFRACPEGLCVRTWTTLQRLLCCANLRRTVNLFWRGFLRDMPFDMATLFNGREIKDLLPHDEAIFGIVPPLLLLITTISLRKPHHIWSDRLIGPTAKESTPPSGRPAAPAVLQPSR